MNKKTKAKLEESLNKALAPFGGKHLIPLPKNSGLTRRELMDMLLENYRDVPLINIKSMNKAFAMKSNSSSYSLLIIL